MGFRACFTENNLGIAFNFESQQVREETLAALIDRRGKSVLPGFVDSGLALTGVPSTLAVSVATGTAIISGYLVQVVGSAEVKGSLTPSATNYIFLQLTISGGVVTAISLGSNTSGTTPSNAAMLGIAVTDGGQVTDTTPAAASPHQPYIGTYTGNDATSDRTIFLGWQPKVVMIESTGSTLTHSISGLTTGARAGVHSEGTADATGNVILSSGTAFRPELVATGFLVKHDGTPPPTVSINANTVVYRYAAWA